MGGGGAAKDRGGRRDGWRRHGGEGDGIVRKTTLSRGREGDVRGVGVASIFWSQPNLAHPYAIQRLAEPLRLTLIRSCF